MKTILVLSDTHGMKPSVASAVRRFADADMIFHLGDYSSDADYIRRLTDKTVYNVRGNCDLRSAADEEMVLSVEGVKILLVHGHNQGVKSSLLRLWLYAREKEADVALFGHTHIAVERFLDGVTLYNPGSLGEPRMNPATVGLMTVDNGTVRFTTVRL